jgi:hypothetical protein
MFFVLISSITSVTSGEDIGSRPTDPKKALNWEVDRLDTRLKRPKTKEEIKQWFRSNGQLLSGDEIKVLRSIIATSDCIYSGYGGDDKSILPERRRVPRPRCGASSEGPLVQCNARMKCKHPALTYYLSATCFSKETVECPDAKTCAMQSDFSLKRNDLYKNEPAFGNMWVWGFANEN